MHRAEPERLVDYSTTCPHARRRPPAGADLYPLPPLDDYGELSHLPADVGGTRPGHAGSAHPTGDPAVDPGRLAAAGTGGNSPTGGPVRCARALLPLAQSRPRVGDRKSVV